MTKCKQRRSLHGAVLIMVLTVMVVLIIMLMATLTVVTTAGQRIYTKFEENQAYYTARSALDVFTENMLNDGAYYAYDNAGNIRLYESGVNMKQGLALQLDLYKIGSQEKSYESESNTELKAWKKMLENPVSSDGIFTDATDQKYFYLDTATGLEYIEYDITFPVIASSSNSYGKIVDISATDLDKNGSFDDQAARIKVEVLERELAHGEYTDAQIETAFKDTAGTAVPSKAEILKSIADSPRSKDKMTIKITATVEFMGVEGVASVILKTNDVKAPAASNAINSLGGLTGSGAGLVAAGGASSLNTGETLIDASGTAGSVFSVGSIHWNSSGSSALDDGAYVYAKNGIKFTNSQNIVPVGQDSFMYTDGTFDIQSSFTAGTDANPINIIADKFQYTNDITVNGNVYANEFYCSINGNLKPPAGNNKVYVKDLYVDEADNLIEYNGGELFCDTTRAEIQAIRNNFVVYGDIYVKGTEGYRKCTTNSFIPEGSGTFDILAKKSVDNADGLKELEVTLPVKLASGSKNKINLPTVESKYSEYFAEDAFDDNGDLVNKAGSASVYDLANLMQTTKSAEESYYEDNGLAVPENPSLNRYTEELTGTEITKSGLLKSVSGDITIDTTSDNITIQLEPGTAYGQKIKVKGSNSVSFIMPEAPTSVPITYQFDQGFEVTTEYITNEANQTINNGNTKAPKINYYVGTNANVQMPSNGSAFLTGYFYMPRSKMTNSSANNGVSKKYEYNGTTTTKNYFIVGSVTCLEYDTGGSNTGVCYIDPTSGSDTPGEPHLSVSASQYTRK